jgi:MoaA/NifB/PqqE/SkfB family radical SAM enzyme
MRNHIKYRTIFVRHSWDIRSVNNQPSEQLIIRVGKWCNFRCIFCNVAENESVLSFKSSIKEIIAITFYKLKHSKIIWNHLNVTISGGEPSIFQKETIFILKYFTSYFQKKGIHVSFDLQSNASNIDIDFAHKIAELWVKQALISSHAHDPEIFESIIGVKYEVMWPKFEQGVQSLLDAGIQISFNIVLNKLNKDHYLEHIIYLSQKYPQVQLYNIWFVQPHGMAQENFERLFIQYADVAKIYARVIAYLKSHGKRVHSHLVGLPLCHMDDWSNSMEYVYNKSLIQGDPEKHTLIQSINDTNKAHPEPCNSCVAKRVCSWVWKEYAPIQKLKPKPYKVYYHRDAIEYSKLDTLRSLYDSWVREFIIPGANFSSHLIQTICAYWYSWIVIVWDRFPSEFDPKIFAWLNLQIHTDSPDFEWTRSVDVYNKRVAFQFRIQIDIIVHSHIGDHIVNHLTLTSDIHLHLKKQWSSLKPISPFMHYFI